MDWKNLVSTLAPAIGTALGGPLGGVAVGAIADALNLTERTEGAIKQALSGVTQEQMLALKQADQAFTIKMQELGISLEQVSANDRDSARKREIEVKDNTPKILAYSITLGFFGMLLVMMFFPIPAESRDIMNYMLGALNTGWIAAITYFYGSTNNSAEKTRLLASSTPPNK